MDCRHDVIHYHPSIWNLTKSHLYMTGTPCPLFNVKLTQQQILDVHGKSPEE